MELFTLKNASGAEVKITNLGGIIVSLTVPDRDGKMADVVLGLDRVEDYPSVGRYLGAIVGRYANRIAGGRFTLGGKEYTLALNNGANALHGGRVGFDKVVWDAAPNLSADPPSLKLEYLSRDGEEGYPGNLRVEAVYSWSNDNALTLRMTATTDKPTIVNLTNHSYFNLAGAGSGDVLAHEVMINAKSFTPVSEALIPTGEIRPVEGTPLDFTRPVAIGARIEADDEQLRRGNGYDHNYVIDKPQGELGLMARVHDPASGRTLEMLSDAPGMQFYTGNFLSGISGRGGAIYDRRHAFCLEPQLYPDSPNKPGFPSAVLEPGQVYRHTIVYRFSAQ